MSVPVPERVPFSTTRVIDGLLPRGRLQSLFIGLVFVPALIDTRLKVAFAHEMVPLLPIKLIVPPLALNVIPAVKVTLPCRLIEPDGAVKTDAAPRVKAPTEVKVDGEEYMVVKEEDILAVIKGDK